MNDERVSEISVAPEAPPFQFGSQPVDVSAKHIRDLVGAGYDGLVDYAMELNRSEKRLRPKERHLLCEIALCSCRTAIALVEAGVTEQKLLNRIFWSGSIFLRQLEPREWLDAWETLEQHPVVRRNLDWRIQLLDGLFDISPNRVEILEFFLSFEKLGFKLDSEHLTYRDYFIGWLFLGRGHKDELRTFAQMVLQSDWEADTKKRKKQLLKMAQEVLKAQE